MNGFLPYNAPFMMDFVVISLAIVVPILIYGVYQVKKQKYRHHAQVMIFLGILVFIVVAFFEASMIYLGGIKNIMENAGRSEAYTPHFSNSLFVHLIFSFSTCVLWIYVLIAGVKNFGLKNPQPNAYSKTHKFYARLSIIAILGVAITGLYVYYLAFIC